MIKEKYICILYIGCWAIYNIQYLFGLEGSLFTRILIVVLIMISFFFFVRVNLFKENPLYIKALDGLLLLLSVYGIAYMFSETIAIYSDQMRGNYNYLKTIYISLLPIYFFYYYSRKNIIDDSFINNLLIFFLILAFFEYCANELSYMRAFESTGVDLEKSEMVNNGSYVFLAIIPALFLFNRSSVFQSFALIYVLVFILLGLKRGAIIIGFVCLVFFLWKTLKEKSKIRFWVSLFLSLFIVVIVVAFIFYLADNNPMFYTRIRDTLEGNSSGRDYLYKRCFDYYLFETSDFQFFFGSGAMATIKVTGNDFAHNDWLELAVNQGFLGVVVYVLYWISFLILIKQTKIFRYRCSLELLFIICFLETFISMSYAAMNIYSTSILGYCIGKHKNWNFKSNHTEQLLE